MDRCGKSTKGKKEKAGRQTERTQRQSYTCSRGSRGTADTTWQVRTAMEGNICSCKLLLIQGLEHQAKDGIHYPVEASPKKKN